MNININILLDPKLSCQLFIPIFPKVEACESQDPESAPAC